ncbi:APC family permease [Nesterenkonia sp. NBAIMH1]|uniref:APC family permease n=1 Tax=Nesterenkonia sp. NBAIMH1 TaxID=2600320 RepID=UPI0011B7EE1E|nr:APC family permease [Nesterenkonia sp. NBAIMH1]
MATEAAAEHQGRADRLFRKTLGKYELFFLGFGSMIGFGWITLTGGWIQDAGVGGAVAAFLIGGAIMALVGLVYAELAAAMPFAGGEHNYLLRGMGPRLALLGSWGIIGGYVTVSMFQSVAVPRSATYLFPDLAQIPMYTIAGTEVYLTWALLGAGTSVLLTFLNIRGIRQSSLLQSSAVIFLLVVAVVMLFASFFGGEPEYIEPMFTGGGAGIIAVLVVVPFLFVGFDVIPQSAEEANLAPRKMGQLIVVSVVAATVFYIVIVSTTALGAPADELGRFDLATGDAMAYMLGHEFWGQLVIAGGLAGVITSWNAFLVGASRLLWALSNAGMVPAWFGRMHPKHGTPVNALLFLGGLTTIAPFFGLAMLDWAVDATGPAVVITFLMVSITFVILRRREPSMDRPLRVGGRKLGMAVGVVAVISTAVMLALYLPGLPAFLTLEPWIIFLAWWTLGIIFALRLPGGIKGGADAERRLLEALDKRQAERGS